MCARLTLLVAAFLVLPLAGCAVIHIPHYIKDEHPYKRTFFVPFDEVYEQSAKALEAHGWRIEGEADPALYEHARASVSGKHAQTMIFTRLQKLSLGLGSRFTRINIFLRALSDTSTEVEVRYLTVTSMNVKTFYDYVNDKAVGGIFDAIEKGLAR